MCDSTSMSTRKSSLKVASLRVKRATSPKKHITITAPPRYRTNDRFVYLSSTIRCGRVISECVFIPSEGRHYSVFFDGATSIECLREDYMSPENTRITKHKASSMIRHTRKKGWHVSENLYNFVVALSTTLKINKKQPVVATSDNNPKIVNTSTPPQCETVITNKVIPRSRGRKVATKIAKVITVVEKVISIGISTNTGTDTASVSTSTVKKCSRAVCTREVYKRGLCKTHVAAYRRKNAFA